MDNNELSDMRVENHMLTSDDIKVILIALETLIEQFEHPDPIFNAEARAILADLTKQAKSAKEKLERVAGGTVIDMKAYEPGDEDEWIRESS